MINFYKFKGFLSVVFILFCFFGIVEVFHLGTLMVVYGYFFFILDYVFIFKDDGIFYRF